MTSPTSPTSPTPEPTPNLDMPPVQASKPRNPWLRSAIENRSDLDSPLSPNDAIVTSALIAIAEELKRANDIAERQERRSMTGVPISLSF